jgi:predicted RNA-binding protein with PIN domain
MLLIDGYNLLHASGVFPAAGPPTLERARLALLDALADALPPNNLATTTIVFDAAGAPPGLPREMAHRGLSVRFARRGGTADELLEDLIEAAADPRRLLVVSSDHGVQRAARRRGARYADSEIWWTELRRSVDMPQDDDRQSITGNPFPPGYARDLLEE